jgi:hypothetical protein
VLPEEKQILYFDRMLPAHLADDARHRIGMPGAVERGARVVDVHPLERGGEAVRVALAPRLAVGDDVQARFLLRLDGEHGGVVLRFFEQRLWNAPQLAGAHPRRKAPGELLAVDEPFRLRIAADERGGK